jgi:hypothetical protein
MSPRRARSGLPIEQSEPKLLFHLKMAFRVIRPETKSNRTSSRINSHPHYKGSQGDFLTIFLPQAVFDKAVVVGLQRDLFVLDDSLSDGDATYRQRLLGDPSPDGDDGR